MAARTSTEPASDSPGTLADQLACALLWVDMAALAIHRLDRPGTARALTHARLQLRAAVRALRGPRED